MSDSVDELVNRLVGSGMVVSFQSYKLGSVNRRMKKLDSQFQLNLNEYATDMRTALNDDTSSFDIELNFNAHYAIPPTTLYSLMDAVANAKVGRVTPRIAHPDSTK
jgi:hypothetical protein